METTYYREKKVLCLETVLLLPQQNNTSNATPLIFTTETLPTPMVVNKMAVPTAAAVAPQNHRANTRNHPSAYLGRNHVRRGGVDNEP
jgi:hypothetical protein